MPALSFNIYTLFYISKLFNCNILILYSKILTFFKFLIIILYKEGEELEKLKDIAIIIREMSNSFDIDIRFFDMINFFILDENAQKINLKRKCELCNNNKIKCNIMHTIDHAKEHPSPFFNQCPLTLYELIVPIYKNNNLHGLILIYEHSHKSYDDTHKIKSDFIISVGNLLKTYFESFPDCNNIFKNSIRPTSSKLSVAEKIKNYIDNFYETPISLKSLSETFSLDRCYLARAYKNHYGTTIFDHLSEVRISHAKTLLRTSKLPINVIATNVGYTDVNYFIKVFKTKEGLTPTQYRTPRRTSLSIELL